MSVSGGSTNNYTWFGGELVGTQTGASITGSPIDDTWYYVSFGNQDCEISDSIFISVDQLPELSFSDADVSICSGESFSLVASSTVAGTLTWFGGELIQPVSGNQLIYTPEATDIYNLSWENASGCYVDTTVMITVVELDITTIPEAAGICGGTTIQLMASGGTAYNWTTITGDPDEMVNSGTSSPLVTPTTSSVYVVQAFSDGGLCSESDTVFVNILDAPFVNAGTDVQICEGDNVILNGISQGETFLEWSSLGDDEFSNPNNNDVAVSPVETTTYSLFVSNNSGCSSADSIEVTVIDCTDTNIALEDIFIPTAFTPNGDGVNDSWEINDILGNTTFSMTIFNSHGHIHLNTIGYNNNFTGQESGFLLPEGTYYYILKKLTNDSSRTGTVTILR